jgi:ankyrin repeat protein
LKYLRLSAIALSLCFIFGETGGALASVSPEAFFGMIDNNDGAGVISALVGGFDVNGAYGNVNEKNAPLTYAVRRTRPEIVKILLDFGADVEWKEFEDGGVSPLMLAVLYAAAPGMPPERKGDAMEIVDILIERGADVNYIGMSTQTPLSWALSAPDYDESSPLLIKKLLEAGADVNPAISRGNSTPLMMAMGNAYIAEWEKGEDRTELIKLLLDAGADPNGKLDGGNTPLHVVAFAEREITRGLPDAGLMPAHSSKISYGIAEMLFDAGADKHIKNDEGKNPFETALENYNFRIAVLLAVR